MDLFIKISQRLKEQYNAQDVILFGSYAKGCANEDSDLDLLVISDSKERYFDRQATVRRLIRDLKTGIPISPIVLTSEELRRRREQGDQFIEEIITTGMRA